MNDKCLISYTIAQATILCRHRLGTTLVVNKSTVVIHLLLGEAKQHVRITILHIELECGREGIA